MGKGRRKIEIEKIEDRQRRNVTFTKRRQGLFKKAEDLSRLTGAEIALIVFSPGGNPFTYSSSPSNDLFNHKFDAKEDEEVDAGDDGYWWDNLNVEGLDTIEKLTAMKNQLIEVKEKIAKRKQELLAKSISTGTPDTTTTTTSAVCKFFFFFFFWVLKTAVPRDQTARTAKPRF
ncbi:hypothetical protein MKW94_007422 [Papaver nudicaule]|uniref:MADS-box domain-containing protein n=1 Tax=Papaver nudicaule TaxID=74823 RepID=A0AA41V8F8_PAPNU|nr:hypothetical protein [Papaver nudicaule]